MSVASPTLNLTHNQTKGVQPDVFADPAFDPVTGYRPGSLRGRRAGVESLLAERAGAAPGRRHSCCGYRRRGNNSEHHRSHTEQSCLHVVFLPIVPAGHPPKPTASVGLQVTLKVKRSCVLTLKSG